MNNCDNLSVVNYFRLLTPKIYLTLGRSELSAEVGAGAFSRSRAQKKKARIRAFYSPHSGNPVSKPKAGWQGERGLE
jgi:hypothetical protein